MSDHSSRPVISDSVLDTLKEMSDILQTGLDRETLEIVVKLCETGVNPEALALVIQELRKEAVRLEAKREKK